MTVKDKIQETEGGSGIPRTELLALVTVGQMISFFLHTLFNRRFIEM